MVAAAFIGGVLLTALLLLLPWWLVAGIYLVCLTALVALVASEPDVQPPPPQPQPVDLGEAIKVRDKTRRGPDVGRAA
jgi:hypothetical protein